MKRIIIIISLLFFHFFVFAQLPADGEYFFPYKSGLTSIVVLKSDSLISYKCIGVLQHCAINSQGTKLNELTNPDKLIFNVETIDSINLTDKPIIRHSLIAIKFIDSNKIKIYYSPTINIGDDIISYINKVDSSEFGLTYFSKGYYEKFGSLKEISTNSDLKEIGDLIKTERYQKIIDSYQKLEQADIYGTTLKNEVLNMACLEKGFNPIGVSKRIKKIRENESKD